MHLREAILPKMKRQEAEEGCVLARGKNCPQLHMLLFPEVRRAALSGLLTVTALLIEEPPAASVCTQAPR